MPGLLRLIQSIPSPKAEPFKRWLAKVGHERLQEIENPELAARRMKEIYRQKGYSEDWAGNARKDLEKKSGRKVSSHENYKKLPEGHRRLRESTEGENQDDGGVVGRG